MKKRFEIFLKLLIVIGISILLIVFAEYIGVGESFTYPTMAFLLFGMWDAFKKGKYQSAFLFILLLSTLIYSQL